MSISYEGSYGGHHVTSNANKNEVNFAYNDYIVSKTTIRNNNVNSRLAVKNQGDYVLQFATDELNIGVEVADNVAGSHKMSLTASTFNLQSYSLK